MTKTCIYVHPFQETLDSLSNLYTCLNEEDLWAGLWTLRCQFSQTVTAIAYESQGLFEQVHNHTHTHTKHTQSCIRYEYVHRGKNINHLNLVLALWNWVSKTRKGRRLL